MYIKKLITLSALGLLFVFWGCTQGQKTTEVPKQERVEKNLVPSKAEAKSKNLVADLSDLKVAMSVDPVSKDILETPSLQGHIKITNTSPDIIDVRGVTLDYLDTSGKVIPFKSGDKAAKASLYMSALKPGEFFEGTLDTTIPRAALKDNSLSKIEIKLVYVPSPLKQEILCLAEKVG